MVSMKCEVLPRSELGASRAPVCLPICGCSFSLSVVPLSGKTLDKKR